MISFRQDPNPDDPLNKEAAEALVSQRAAFERQVPVVRKGGQGYGQRFADGRCRD